MSHKQVISQIEKIMADYIGDYSDNITTETIKERLDVRFFENLFISDFNVSFTDDKKGLIVEVGIDTIPYRITMTEHKFQMFTPEFKVEQL